jgi:hypothetical protein
MVTSLHRDAGRIEEGKMPGSKETLWGGYSIGMIERIQST